VVRTKSRSVIVATSNCPLKDSSFGPIRKLVWSMTSWRDGSEP
jgi:hypothetical protein